MGSSVAGCQVIHDYAFLGALRSAAANDLL